MIPLFVGYDRRESVAYHVFCHSVIEKATSPVAIHPLSLQMLQDEYRENHTDGSNAFIYSRFLVPHLMEYQGWAIFCDGDMVTTADIAKLWALRDESKAVMVAKHDYKTKAATKYIGTSMETINTNYPRKNWSSVILWNCGHPSNAILTPRYVSDSTGANLHRFRHLKDEEIGSLPLEWNWLPQEQGPNYKANLLHYSLGVPAIEHYKDGDQVDSWWTAYHGVNHVQT